MAATSFVGALEPLGPAVNPQVGVARWVLVEGHFHEHRNRWDFWPLCRRSPADRISHPVRMVREMELSCLTSQDAGRPYKGRGK